jgi:hypothetical protein
VYALRATKCAKEIQAGERSIPERQMYDSAGLRFNRRIGSFLPALLGQPHLSRSRCRMPAIQPILPLYRQATTLRKHGTPPSGSGWI